MQNTKYKLQKFKKSKQKRINKNRNKFKWKKYTCCKNNEKKRKHFTRKNNK